MVEPVVIFCQCIAGEHPAEFQNFSHGEIIYNCLHCGGAIIDHQDCLGG